MTLANRDAQNARFKKVANAQKQRDFVGFGEVGVNGQGANDIIAVRKRTIHECELSGYSAFVACVNAADASRTDQFVLCVVPDLGGQETRRGTGVDYALPIRSPTAGVFE